MNARDLRELCAHWDRSPDGFTQIVKSAIGMVYQRELAVEFEVAVSTVSRWASGAARPHTRIQKLIVDEIDKRARRAVAAETAVNQPAPAAVFAKAKIRHR